MSLPAWHEEPVLKKHDRKSFDCGDPPMNDFLQRYARQSHESGAAKTFLAIGNADNKTILGFYSLAPGAMAYADTPETVRRGLARHDVPGFRLAQGIAADRMTRTDLGKGNSLNMWRTCNCACSMTKMIQLRNVPDALYRGLKARAAMAGMSLSD